MHFLYLFAAVTATASASFTNKCQSCSLIINKAEAGVMGCDCFNDANQLVGSILRLSTCFANADGKLIPQANGNFVKSCSVEGLFPSSQRSLFLSVKCKDNSGNTQSGSFDINAGSTITSVNGVMKCFGQGGPN
ncbi:hypothetical protein COCMIDRAFT_109284 [Bipolaris oryzae ATCC 44560]|uniref:Cyanovirin-N domain-containing protein n=1 Tax=Bipolaris oryzae ATCC 44560 TaxID=930090 RepID=W6YM21_COCMI|nr:uncharacterized protein COCMIDRAFT_109284 [Bipolaris oryzae ATCC 44560]EUC40267.1 hypothetical protein COCMIDRAFT_109284 [Bipolaris oryzae ATCC 44560]